MTKTVIYTDVGCTFVDVHGSYVESRPALLDAQDEGVPIVFVSWENRLQLADLCWNLRIDDPFSSENGGAVYVRREYFPFEYWGTPGPVGVPVRQRGAGISRLHSHDEYDVIELSVPHAAVVSALHTIRDELGLGDRLVVLSDLSADELAVECGLTLGQAERAKARDWSEAFRIRDADQSLIGQVIERIEQAGLRYSFGAGSHRIQGPTDKGNAVRELKWLFARRFGADVRSVGIGNGLNDISLLREADTAFLVQGPDGTHDERVLHAVPGAIPVSASGPPGWAIAVRAVLAGTV